VISVHSKVGKEEYKTDKVKAHFTLSATHRSKCLVVYSCMSVYPNLNEETSVMLWLLQEDISRIIIFKLIKYFLITFMLLYKTEYVNTLLKTRYDEYIFVNEYQRF